MCTHGVHALQKCVSQTHSKRFDELIALLKNPKMLQMYTIWNQLALEEYMVKDMNSVATEAEHFFILGSVGKPNLV